MDVDEVFVFFEWDEEGDRGVNGGDNLWVCDCFFLLFVCCVVFWDVLFVVKGFNWDVIIKFNLWLVLNVL